ncbi:hypothetical protein [Novacetimonas hansenii]|uniref:hypothetical protein n=1 Tax=Novacetimonas hansenii TaxID=436 RepID=UPI0007924F48|nr:hypothetical protein [Novacetimonas hansenii]WEQ58219.1 hypothetical protein LV563_10100 [Novacetimonas hansenii]CUW48643.1 hypothetical protein ATCC53582_02784 [Novacetimonas hansenii]
MNLFHTSPWHSFNEIFNSKLIIPQPLSIDDDKNPTLKLLRQNGINCAWFSSQRWINSIFGSYIFEYDADNLIISRDLVHIGSHNNAETYISTTDIFSKWLTSKEPSAKIKKITGFSDIQSEERVDLIFHTPIPASENIDFTTSLRVDENEKVKGSSFSKIRCIAKMLLKNDNFFTPSFSRHLDDAALLFRYMYGEYDFKFKKNRSKIDKEIHESPDDLFNYALQLFVDGDPITAAIIAAHIGEEDALANTVAKNYNKFFNTSFSGENLIKHA